MEFSTAVVVVRPNIEGVPELIFRAESIKEARYCLKHFGKHLDAVLLTPKSDHYRSNKDSDIDSPIYNCHLNNFGQFEFNENSWLATTAIIPHGLSYLKNSLAPLSFNETLVLEPASNNYESVLKDILCLSDSQVENLRTILSGSWEVRNQAQMKTIINRDPLLLSINPGSNRFTSMTMRIKNESMELSLNSNNL